MMAQRYSWLFGGYRPRQLNKVMFTNQSHASSNTSLRTPSRDGPKVTTCVTVFIVRLPVLQLTTSRRRGCWPVGLPSLMVTLRTTNEPKLRYAHLVNLLGCPVELTRYRSSNSRTRIFQRSARRTRQRRSKYYTFCILFASIHIELQRQIRTE
jgi:hypothetical protein